LIVYSMKLGTMKRSLDKLNELKNLRVTEEVFDKFKNTTKDKN